MSCKNSISIILMVVLVLLEGNSLAYSKTAAEKLLTDLACSNCHFGLSFESDILIKTPDLSYAGIKYNPAYLFKYLKNPTQIRRDIGNTRMPDFKFSDKEGLALTLFLTEQKAVSQKLESIFPLKLLTDSPHSSLRKGREIVEKLCIICHISSHRKNQTTNRTNLIGMELMDIGFRLNRDWVKKWIAYPGAYSPTSTMPSLFYAFNNKYNIFTRLDDSADHKVNDITDYLFYMSRVKREVIQGDFDRIKSLYPEIDSRQGEKIFISQNCIACHKIESININRAKNGPDLNIEGIRVKRNWLKRYLENPYPVRPFGFYSGTGSRMPDFRLTEKEAALITNYLMEQKGKQKDRESRFKYKRLSAFSNKKAKLLLQNKLPCLGCHKLGAEGGEIGPDLSSINKRLQDSFVYEYIKNPRKFVKETVMPRIYMPEKELLLISDYLLGQNIPRGKSKRLSLIETPIYSLNGNDNKNTKLYLRYCSSCHGVKGNGNGYNYINLKKQPTRHSDSNYMSTRPDDTLFDGIYSGGYILNKSNEMPPWGLTLKKEDIYGLVSHIRSLCNCNGPLWSQDNK